MQIKKKLYKLLFGLVIIVSSIIYVQAAHAIKYPYPDEEKYKCPDDKLNVPTEQFLKKLESEGINHINYPAGLCFPSFNNYTDNNNPIYVDERKFLRVKKIDCSESDCDKYLLNVSVKKGDKLRFVGFAHNDANPLYNGSNDKGWAVATNVKTGFNSFILEGKDYFSDSDTSIDIEQFISANNTYPKKKSFSVNVKKSSQEKSKTIRLKYIPKSAKFTLIPYLEGEDSNNNGIPDEEEYTPDPRINYTVYPWPDSQIKNFFGLGAPLGSPVKGSSNFLGCEPYETYIAFDVEVIAGEEEKPKVCENFRLNAPTTIYEGTYTATNAIDLSVSGFQPSEYASEVAKGNITFYWNINNENAAFYDPGTGKQLTKINSTTYTTTKTQVELRGNLKENDRIQVWEETIKNDPCKKSVTVKKKIEEKKVCEGFTLTAPSNIYEGTYDNSNSIVLSVKDFQPPEYASEVAKGNITFYWNINNENAAFYDPDTGAKLTELNPNTYATKKTRVILKGNLSKGNKIQVWESSIKKEPCIKSITVKAKEEIKKCENLILKSPSLEKQGSFYILPTNTNQQLQFEMTVIGNYITNDLQINTSYGSSNQFVTKCSSTFPNFCYNYNGDLPQNETITFSDPTGAKCYVPFISKQKVVEPDKCISFSSPNPPTINKDVNNHPQKVTFNYEKTSGYTLNLEATPSSYLSLIGCSSTTSRTGTCEYQYTGGFTGSTLTIKDQIYSSNCKIDISLTEDHGPGGEDKCIKFSKPIPSSIDKDVNNDAREITFDYEKTSNYDLNFKLDPESHLSKISCTPESNTSANSGTCKFQYTGGFTGAKLSIKDLYYQDNCNIDIPLIEDHGPGGEICTIDEIRDQYGNKVTALAPNTTAKLQISGTNLLNNKLTWQFLNNSKNISTSVGTFQNNQAEFDSYILPGQVTATTKTQRGTLKVAGTDTRGTPCVREIPVLAVEERCIDLTILPEAKYLPFIPAGTTMNLSWEINPPYLVAPSWYVTPPEAGKIAQINAAGKYVTLETYGEGKVVAIYLDDSDRCYDERPIKKEIIHEREFNDEIKKIANPTTINTKIIEAGGTEVINYTVEYFLNVDPNPITQITFIDTISGTGEIHGRGNNANKLVYNNNEKYYVYDKNGNSLSTTISGKLVDSGGITFSNLPVETHKIKITYEMLAKPEHIKVDCTSNICGEAFPNTVLRRIPGIDDKYASAKVYYLCPYLLTRNGGEVFFEEEFIYGADVSCIDNTVRNTTGIAFIEREKKEEPKIIDTGPNNDWIKNASFCDNEYQNPDRAENNKVISRFSSYICEIKTKFIDPWKKPFVYALMTENQERILRNYKPIERGINTILSLSNNEFTLLQAFSKNPNPQKNILYFDGNKLNNKKLILGTGFRDLEIENGAKTIVLTNGDLIIKDNIVYKIPASSEFLTYQNNHKEIPSIAFIVVNGNIYIDPKVEKIQGIFYVQQKDTNTGQLKASNEKISYQQLTVRGSVLGDIQPLFKKRKYIGPASMDGGAIVIRYDERVLLNTPPGIEQYLNLDWLKSAKSQ